MLRMVDYKQVNNILGLTGSNALSPNERCIWKKQASDKGADETELNKSPFDTWAHNRLIPVSVIKVSKVFYDITFVDDDEVTIIEGPTQVEENHKINKPAENPTKIDPEGKKVYEFSGWALSTDRTKHLGVEIKSAQDNYTFVAEYNGTDIPDGNVKTMDNIGQLENYAKQKPESGKNGDIGVYWTQSQNGWFSLPHDGNDTDVMGEDGGISPQGSATGRTQVTKDGKTYTFYESDSIIYEFLHRSDDYAYAEGGYVPENSITADSLLSEWSGKDENGNVVMHIKSLHDWVKFAIIGPAEGTSWPIKFNDTSGVNDPITVPNIPIKFMIAYFIEDNTNAASRLGKVQVTTEGGDCSYVADYWGSNNKYMTDGRVYIYQLGTNYTLP